MRTPVHHFGDVPLARFQVMRNGAWDGVHLAVLNVKQGDVPFIHAEAEQIVVALILIPPDYARRLDSARFGLDLEFDAQVRVPADYFVEDGERKFGILGSGRKLLQNVGAGRCGLVRFDFPVRSARGPGGGAGPVCRHAARFLIVEIDGFDSDSEDREADEDGPDA